MSDFFSDVGDIFKTGLSRAVDLELREEYGAPAEPQIVESEPGRGAMLAGVVPGQVAGLPTSIWLIGGALVVGAFILASR